MAFSPFWIVRMVSDMIQLSARLDSWALDELDIFNKCGVKRLSTGNQEPPSFC